MTELLILITALTFFFLGRWSTGKKTAENDTISEIVDRFRNPKVKPGPIKFKTLNDIEDEESGETALADHWEKSGIGDLVRETK